MDDFCRSKTPLKIPRVEDMAFFGLGKIAEQG
jgi:hypothetical protein